MAKLDTVVVVVVAVLNVWRFDCVNACQDVDPQVCAKNAEYCSSRPPVKENCPVTCKTCPVISSSVNPQPASSSAGPVSTAVVAGRPGTGNTTITTTHVTIKATSRAADLTPGSTRHLLMAASVVFVIFDALCAA